MLLDSDGRYMHTGRYWDPESREHTSGEGHGHRMYSAVPFDSDGDGDLDLLFGTNQGALFLRENVGSPKAPSFDTEQDPLPGTTPKRGFTQGYAMPVVVDWDGDGLMDLVSGGKSGGAYWLRNVGEKNAPKFEVERPLLTPAAMSRHGVGSRTQLDVVDFDLDGDLDLVVGDYAQEGATPERSRRGNVWLFAQSGTPERGAPSAASSGGE